MVPITWRASSFHVFFVCMLRDWRFQKQNRKEEEEEGETEQQQQQTYQFTKGYNILHRLQVHHLTLTFKYQHYILIHKYDMLFILQSCFSFFVSLHGQPEPFGSCIILQSCSSFSTANLSCLLATTFSSLSFLSNSFSSPLFNLLRVARRCFAWSLFLTTFS